MYVRKEVLFFWVQTFLDSNQAIVKKRLIACLVLVHIQLFYVYVDDYPLSTSIRKISDPGLAWCTLCKKDIKYASSGKKAFIGHCGSAWHAHLLREQKSNYTIACKYVRDFM